MLLILDDPGGEPILEEVTAPVVPAVEALGVEPVQPVDGMRHLLSLRFDHEVVMRAVV